MPKKADAGYNIPFYKSVSFKFIMVAAGVASPLIITIFPLYVYGWPVMTEQGKVYAIAAGALACFIELGALTYLYRQWVNKSKELLKGAEIVRLSNLSHQIDVYSGDELEQTARSLQAVGRMAQEAFSRLEAMIDVEVEELKREKTGLSHVLDTVGSGVVVTNPDGLIILCNRKADLLLNTKASIIGHSIFAYLDRNAFFEAMERVRPDAQDAVPQVEIMVEIEESFIVFVAPYIESGSYHGYVLTFWAASGKKEAMALGGKPFESRPEYFDFDLLSSNSAPNNNASLLDMDLEEALIVSFDTETTGLHPSGGDKIVSIGAVRIRNGKIREGEKYDTLVDPERPIPEFSTQFHNITDEMVKGEPKLVEVLPQFIKFCEEAVLLGHNVAFDLKFLNIHLEREGKPAVSRFVLDTLLLSFVLHHHYEDHNLKSLADRLGVNAVGLHTSLGDALTTAEVFLKIVPLLKSVGVRTVGEAIRFSKKAYGIRREQDKF